MKAVAKPLSLEECAELAEHELIISQGIKAFLAVGNALLAIRDKKLYRAQHSNFEDYCRVKWNMAHSQAYRLMDASQIVEKLSPSGGKMIENERQARALSAVPPHLREVVLERIKDNEDEVTEQSVTKAVVTILREKEEARRDESAEKDEEETAAEPEAEETPVERPAPTTLERAAARCEKDRLYLERGLEHLRLAVKDLKKVNVGDLQAEDARRRALSAFETAEAAFSAVRGFAEMAEAG